MFSKQVVRQTADQYDISGKDSEFALKYLEYYYVENKSVALAVTDTTALIKKFQKTFGLKVNGNLDEQTIRAMHWPRCGCPDYKMVKSLSDPQAAKWGPKRLTYYVEKYVSGLPKADQDDLLELAFKQWEDNCQLAIDRVTSSSTANLIISTGSGRTDNFDGPGGTLAWAYLPPNNNYNGQLLMRFDLSETWISNERDRGILFLNVACHEFGHMLGLDHSSVQRALMAPYYSPGITKPQANDDIPRIQKLYGTPSPTPNPNPTPGPTPTPDPKPGEHSISVTGLNLSQIRVDGRSISDFSLI